MTKADINEMAKDLIADALAQVAPSVRDNASIYYTEDDEIAAVPEIIAAYREIAEKICASIGRKYDERF